MPTKYPLKTWGDDDWWRPLSETLSVTRVDEDIPTNEQQPVRKPRFIALMQKPGTLAE